MKIQLTRC